MVALRYIDSFDHLVTADLGDKWTTVTGAPAISAGNGRSGTAGLQLVSIAGAISVARTLDAQASWVVGFAFRYSAVAGSARAICSLLDAGTAQCSLVLNLDGTISVLRGALGGTILTSGTSVAAMSTGTWYHVEWKVTIANSIGASTCKVRLNGVDIITVATSQDTQATANATANGVRFGPDANPSNAPTWGYDDIYVCDGTGLVNNDFLGDMMVSVLYPAGAGNTTGWTPSAGLNWQNVDDPGDPDDDATYNSTATPGAVDLYTLSDLSATPASIAGIQWNAEIRKDDASAYVLHRMLRSGGADHEGSTAIAPNTTYVNYTEILESDPFTTSAWLPAGVNALEAGLKLISVT